MTYAVSAVPALPNPSAMLVIAAAVLVWSLVVFVVKRGYVSLVAMMVWKWTLRGVESLRTALSVLCGHSVRSAR